MITIFRMFIVLAAMTSLLSAGEWLENFTNVPYSVCDFSGKAGIEVLQNDPPGIKKNRSTTGAPLKVREKAFEHGLGVHAFSHLRVHAPLDIVRFESWIGVNEQRDRMIRGHADFIVQDNEGRQLARKNAMHTHVEAFKIDLPVNRLRQIDLLVTDSGNGVGCDHADWGEAKIHLDDGTVLSLADMDIVLADSPISRYPFSFVYGGKSSDQLLPGWKMTKTAGVSDESRETSLVKWSDPETGLVVEWAIIRFKEYPAIESLLHFENTGKEETPILENVQALSCSITDGLSSSAPYWLYRTNGAPSNGTDFEFNKAPIDAGAAAILKAKGGRSSNGDFPFYKIDHKDGALITAVGWSGQWKTTLACRKNGCLDMTTGLEKTHFKLLPGERVRMPRILLLDRPGKPNETWEANALFRQLIYKHYAAHRGGKPILPTPFCNTCFTRGGGWLNETTAENQISLINAYADIGVKTLMTDAGWFIGGWPGGAGNWTPDPVKYPRGMAPVAKAALGRGGIYGLWFEPERVVLGTPIHREHSEWLIEAKSGQKGRYLLNMGIPAARDYFFGIVKEYLELPGFEVYRQDFNMDPLVYWTSNDAEDRQGITELKYIEGLYAYWDKIAENYPGSFREECASGGRRIDLETIMRMHVHQDSDYWFRWETDQNQVWGLSQYLPNSVFVGHVQFMDEYGFWANIATSLCFGWIADDPGFDKAKAKAMVDKYFAYRELFVGAWYPLIVSGHDATQWMASQYYRPDIEKGIVIAQRREKSPYISVKTGLFGLDAAAMYEVRNEMSGETIKRTGAELMKGISISILEPRSTVALLYWKSNP